MRWIGSSLQFDFYVEPFGGVIWEARAWKLCHFENTRRSGYIYHLILAHTIYPTAEYGRISTWALGIHVVVEFIEGVENDSVRFGVAGGGFQSLRQLCGGGVKWGHLWPH